MRVTVFFVLLLALASSWCNRVSAFGITSSTLGVSTRSTNTQDPMKRWLLFPLFMVSQKEKRRRQEGAKRRQAFEEHKMKQAQTALVVQLQELKGSSASFRNKAVAAKKLLKNAQHDGLDDIGRDARALVLEMFYKADRPADLVEHVVVRATGSPASNAVATDNDPNLLQYGLWAYCTLEDWPSAASFADRLFFPEVMDVSVPSATAFSTPKQRLQLIRYAIQAYANTDNHHLDRAMELFDQYLVNWNETDGASAITDTKNILLCSLVQSGRSHDFKALYYKGLEQQTPMCPLNKRSHYFALECAEQTGDVQLMEKALGGHSEGTTTEKLQILKTFGQAIANGKELSFTHQKMINSTLQDLIEENVGNIDPETLSNVLVALDDDFVAEAVLRIERKNRKNWYASLTTPAKARVLPGLYESETNAGNDTSGGDAWKLFTSLVKMDKKTKAITEESRKFLRSQKDFRFCVAALNLTLMEGNQREFYQAILQECWEILSRSFYDSKTMECDYYFVKSIVTELVNLPSEAVRIELFGNLISTLSTKEQDEKIGALPSFTNAKLTLIVQSTLSFLRVSANKLAASTSDIDNEDTYACRLRKLGIIVSKVAMVLIGTLEEFSSEYYWDYGSSDNGAKEALQTVMKELLLSNLLADDSELVPCAIQYFSSLANVAQSSSAIEYDELLFPISSSRLFSVSTYANPFQSFRNCVLQEKKNEGWSAGKLLDDLATTLLGNEGRGRDLDPLLSSVVGMTIELDRRTRSNSYGTLASVYRGFFLTERRDLFFDRQLLSGLCNEMTVHVSVFSDLQKLDIQGSKMLSRFFLTPDFASAMIDRLETLNDARYWIVEKMQVMGVKQTIFVSASYLVNLYAQRKAFDEIVSNEENPKKLSKAFDNACGKNCDYLMKAILSATEMKKGRRGRSACPVWSDAVSLIIEHISGAVADRKESDNPFIARLVDDVLAFFLASIPYADEDALRFFTNLESIDSLSPVIRDSITDWRKGFIELLRQTENKRNNGKPIS